MLQFKFWQISRTFLRNFFSPKILLASNYRQLEGLVARFNTRTNWVALFWVTATTLNFAVVIASPWPMKLYTHLKIVPKKIFVILSLIYLPVVIWFIMTVYEFFHNLAVCWKCHFTLLNIVDMSKYTNICISIPRNLCKTVVVKYRKTYNGIALTVASHCFKARNQFTMFCIHFIDKFE